MAAQCSSCKQPLQFVRMAESGRRMPVDGIDPQGTVAAKRNGAQWVAGRVITGDRPLLPGETPLRTHYATCPEAGKHRKPAARKPAAKTTDNTLF